jgi:hypothetical protein
LRESSTLAIYFFHLTEGDAFTPDWDGVERPDLAAVEDLAIETAADLIAEAVKQGTCDYSGRFDVENERGEQVLALTFACPIEITVVSDPRGG